MGSLRRRAALGAAVILGALAAGLGDPSPPRAEANVACDVISPADSVTGAIGIGDPAADACKKLTDPVLGAADNALDPLKDAAKSIGEGVFDQITTWASEGAVWLLGRVVALTNETTSPNLTSKGFLRQYRQMASIAVVLAVLMLILAALESLGRGDGTMLWRVFLINLPVAALATSAAYVVVGLLIATTDGFCEVIANSTGKDTRAFFKGAVEALAETGGGAGAALGTAADGAGAGTAKGGAAGAAAVPLFVGFIAAIIAAFAAFLVWVELLMRDAAIYAVALFMPLALAASIWPRWSGTLRRTAEILIVVVFSKFVIVAIIALATSLLANTGGKVEHVLAAGALLLLACFSPFVLFKLVPFAEGAVSSAYSRQSAAGASARTLQLGSSAQMLRRSALANWSGAAGAKGGGSAGAHGGGKGDGAAAAGRRSSGSVASAGGASGSAASGAALPLVAGAAAARASGAAAGKLAGSGTAEASAEGGGQARQSAAPGTGSEAKAPRPRPRQDGATEQGAQSASGAAAQPSEASGGKAPGADAKPPRPAGELRPAEEPTSEKSAP